MQRRRRELPATIRQLSRRALRAGAVTKLAAGDRIVGPPFDNPTDNAVPFLLPRTGPPSVRLADALTAAGHGPGGAMLTHAQITRGGELVRGRANLRDIGARAWIAGLPR